MAGIEYLRREIVRFRKVWDTGGGWVHKLR